MPMCLCAGSLMEMFVDVTSVVWLAIMIEPNTPSTDTRNPYRAPVAGRETQQGVLEYLLCESDQVNFGKTGWFERWPTCREMVYSDRIELALLARSIELPLSHVRLLKSEGRGADRCLRIVHTDPSAPETIRLYPHHPERWYSVFESLGIPTEDEARFRESQQLALRSSRWISSLEGGFWLLLIGGSLVAGAISGVINALGS